LLLVLDKSKLDTLKKKKSKKQIKKQPNIILMLECLEEFFNADLELFKNKIGLFIRFRNSIVHKGSKLFESEHYKDFIDCIDIEKDIFYFKDLKFSLLLLEEISTLFNFITKCNSD